MRQHITVEQLNKLSEKGKERLLEWWKPKLGDMVLWDGDRVGPLNNNNQGFWDDMLNTHDYKDGDYYPLLSIGQMIEFLDESNKYFFSLHWIGKEPWNRRRIWGLEKHIKDIHTYDDSFEIIDIKGSHTQLVDSLWEAVKEVLESEKYEQT